MTPPLGRIALCYGTRPQVVKASALVEALRSDWDLITIDTGQHYDWELNGLHYQQLDIRPPDLFLEVKAEGHAKQSAAVLLRAAEALEEHRPDAVLVIGDTNSTLGCALAATQQRRYVVHVEAGLRSSDGQMAEEINRRVVDEISTLLCAPSRATTEYLRGRASPNQNVVFTGDVARDVLERAQTLPAFPEAPWKRVGIEPPYLLATLHRAELTNRRDWLAAIVRGLGKVPYPVFFPVHPRTAAVLKDQGLASNMPDNIVLGPPVGYLDLIAWARTAEAVVTDSGGLQREAYWLGVPCVTARGESEWKETVAEGANVLLHPQHGERLADVVAEHIPRRGQWAGAAYGTGRAAEAVRDALRSAFASRP